MGRFSSRMKIFVDYFRLVESVASLLNVFGPGHEVFEVIRFLIRVFRNLCKKQFQIIVYSQVVGFGCFYKAVDYCTGAGAFFRSKRSIMSTFYP